MTEATTAGKYGLDDWWWWRGDVLAETSPATNHAPPLPSPSPYPSALNSSISHTHTPSLFFLYRTRYEDLSDTPFDFAHKPRGWLVQLGYNNDDVRYTLEINGWKYEDMTEAPQRERAALARSAITASMDGPKK